MRRPLELTIIPRGRNRRTVRVSDTTAGTACERDERLCRCGMWISQEIAEHSEGNSRPCSGNPWRDAR
jgi:hypothetical protein